MRMAAILAVVMVSPAVAEVPRVVTDFGPVQSLVMDVMGDLGTPVMLMEGGADPHDFQLRPSQAQQLQEADLVIWVGPELTQSLGDALSSLAEGAEVLSLMHDGGGTQRPFEAAKDQAPDDEHAHDEAQAKEDEEVHDHGHDHGAIDPHGWLSPVNGAAWAGKIAQTLGARDPANAATYAANAAALQSRLTALDSDLKAALTPVKDRPFVVYHDALGYFTDHYGLTVVGAIELSDATPPSAGRLAEIQALFEQSGAVCVFPEAGRDPTLIASLTDGLPVRIGAAQDLEFLERQPGKGQYEAMLRDIGTSIANCLTQG